MKKIDDWEYSYSPVQEGLKSISEIFPFAENWYWYLLILIIILCILAPAVISLYGAVKWLRNRDNPEMRNLGKHKFSLGVPTLILLMGGVASYFTGKRTADEEIVMIVVLITLGLYLLSMIILFVHGVYVRIKYRSDTTRKKLGRNTVLLTLYQGSALLLLPFFMVSYLNNNLLDFTSASSPTSYSSTSSMDSLTLGESSPVFSGFDFGAEVESDTVGFSTGGAKDINNFRENINNGYMPLSTDITYEGLFYDYLFDTGQLEACKELFCPSYTSAISPDPFSNKSEYFLSVGLNSGIKESDFQRKKLNLVVVLDISGSMSSAFNKYYYDGLLSEEGEDIDNNASKMEVATNAVVTMLDHLHPDDRFGMVVFDDQAYVGKPLRLVEETDVDSIKDHILELQPRGGTNMESGITAGTELFNDYLDADTEEYENRIIFLTDAMPNTGRTGRNDLLSLTQNNAIQSINTTFIGIGVDFNTDLVESLTKIRGANYYAVHSSEEFRHRMDEGFDYMVTPLVYDLQLMLDAPGYTIKQVYGSPEADAATGNLMTINTLFPSEKTNGETRGGLVLLHMERTSLNNTPISLTAKYTDRAGTTHSNTDEIVFTDQSSYYDNTGIRKGIVLSRYVNVLQDWIAATPTQSNVVPLYSETGIPIPQELQLSQWERTSNTLIVSNAYKNIFTQFNAYFESEMTAIGDDDLEQESVLLERLIRY